MTLRNQNAKALGVLTSIALTLCLAACAQDEVVPSPAGPATHGFLVAGNAFTQPISDLGRDELNDFIAGRTLFVQPWIEAPSSTQTRDGLGPLFNARACETCHPNNGRANPLDRAGKVSSGLLFRLGSIAGPDPVYGGQLQPQALPSIPAEGQPTRRLEPMPNRPELMRPSYAFQDLAYGPIAPSSGFSPRIGGALAGMGLIEAVPVSRWTSLADPEDKDKNGVSGRVHWVTMKPGQAPVMGRFGWKAEMPSLAEQTASAYHDDMGLTNPLRPGVPCTPSQQSCLDAIDGGKPEVSAQALEQTVRYVQFLAVPRSPKRMAAPAWFANLERFERVGCADCHVPAHRTGGVQDGVLAPLADIEIWPFTDMLLHDMGPDLADSRPLPGASPQEWRTPPLWGLGHYESVNDHRFLMHDGRAQGVAQAIAWHGGEAQAAKDAFFALEPAAQAELVAFVEQL